MFKFGKIPPRTSESFGVSGLLGDDCKVYYENFFGLQHLGRSSDLICARLGGLGLDELKVRTLLLFSVFEAYRAHSASGGSKTANEPVTLECGVDSEKMVLGVLFRGEPEHPVDGLPERVAAGKTQGYFENLIARIHQAADVTVLRVQPGVQMEIVSFIGIPNKVTLPPEKPPLKIQSFGDPSRIEKAPPAQEYVELGDVDYKKLLQVRKPKETSASSSGEVLSQEFLELEKALRVRAHQRLVEEHAVVKGGGAEPEEEAHVKGGGDLFNDDLIRVKGRKEAQDDESVRVKGGEEDLGNDLVRVKGGDADARDSGPLTLKSLLSKVWPFRKQSTHPSGEVSPEDAGSSGSTARIPLPEKTEGDSGETDQILTSLMSDMEKGVLQKTVARLQEELEQLKKEGGSSKPKRWMEEMMNELMAEKGRLNNTARQLSQTLHQKEREFKRTEALLKEELRKQEELLRQRTAALERSKEQLSQTSDTMERMKQTKPETSEEAQFKQKYELTQKLLANAKAENAKMNEKMEELRSQLMNLQVGAKSKNSAAQSELAAMRNKYERTNKALEEMKAAHDNLAATHKQLVARMQSAAEKEERAASAGDARRLEAAMRQVANNQKEMEKMRTRIEEYQEAELRLKRELHLSQQELRGLKAKLGIGSKGGGGGRVA